MFEILEHLLYPGKLTLFFVDTGKEVLWQTVNT